MDVAKRVGFGQIQCERTSASVQQLIRSAQSAIGMLAFMALLLRVLASPAAGQVGGSCGVSGQAPTNGLTVGAQVALGLASASACSALDTSGDGHVTVDEIVAAVGKEGAAGRLTALATTPAPNAVVAPSVDIGTATGAPGQEVMYPVSLHTGGVNVAGMQNDTSFDSTNTPVAAKADGTPDCCGNPDINKNFTGFSFQPPGCSGTGCTGMRALVIALDNVDPIPDGSILYTCKAAISPSAADGDYPLTISNFILATPAGERVPDVVGNSGKITVGPPPAPSPCGNGVIDAGEECDDGGLCIGGANAGTACTAAAQCGGGECTPFGGDGCAANCTSESEAFFQLVPGQVQGNGVVAGTSGVVLHGDILTIPLALTGNQILTIGKQRDGHIPFVIKADSVNLPRVNVATLACVCQRSVAVKTCGGTLFESDGVTPSLDCSPDFTAGDSVCAGGNPCAFVHGPGNSAAGVIGCTSLDGVNFTITQDAGGSSGIAGPPIVTRCGIGGPGSATLLSSAATGTIIGSCNGTTAAYGPDGEFCTDDDPPDVRGVPLTSALVTGTATVKILNANSLDGDQIGPFSAHGAPFACSELAQGIATGVSLAGAFITLAQPTLGDVAVTTTQVAGTPPCGDGITQPGQQCDDGNQIDGDGCDSNCTFTGCGNGIVTDGEQCDDSNTVSGDCCSATCQLEEGLCDDGNACSQTDTCQNGVCIGGEFVICADDGNVCNGPEHCEPASGSCVSGPPLPDADGDQVCDVVDNCPFSFNPDQTDSDGDGFGDACDSCVGPGPFDFDGDGICSGADNCPFASNPDQADSDGDGVGDACDNCPAVSNPDQTDTDFNGLGDACQDCAQFDDSDGDNVCNEVDNCLSTPNASQVDTDHDGVGDACDNCPTTPNADQRDDDFNGRGDACQLCPLFSDSDGDNVCDGVDNCPFNFNPDQADSDHDGFGDACDFCVGPGQFDFDGDNICSAADNCPFAYNPDQTDSDGDGVGDACDNCLAVPNHDQADADFDGIGDACDSCIDVDGDGFGDLQPPKPDKSPNGQKLPKGDKPPKQCPADNCPFLYNPDQADGDHDGVGDVCDNCPTKTNPNQHDRDSNGVGDACQK